MVEMAGEDQEPEDHNKAEEPVSGGEEPQAEHAAEGEARADVEADAPAEAEARAEDPGSASEPEPQEGKGRAGRRAKEASGEAAELDGPPGEEPAAASVSVTEQPKATPETPAPPCPICGLTWDDHNVARVRECMAELEHALAHAEKARIRASLTLPDSALNHRAEPVEAAPEPEREA